MRDYSKYEKTPVLFSGAEKKFEIVIDGFRYIVKFQKNSEVGLTGAAAGSSNCSGP